MIGQREVWLFAKHLINQHDDAAVFEAAFNADAMLNRGDLDGERHWIRIMTAVKELKRKEPASGEMVH